MLSKQESYNIFCKITEYEKFKFMRFIVKALILSLFVSCSSDNRSIVYPKSAGLSYSESEQGFVNTVSSLRDEAIYAGFKLEHSFDLKAYAELNKRRSREAQLLFLSNPKLEIPLIQESPTVGIEFPTRMFTYVDRNKYVLVAYNSPDYLKLGYDLENVDSKVKNLEHSISEFVVRATGASPMSNSNSYAGSTLKKQKSNKTFDQTFNMLRNMVLDNKNFKEELVVDHKQNAALIGEKIQPNKVLLFTTGTTEADLIDRYQIASVDLPLRFLVWEDKNGVVQVSWIDLDAIVNRHGVDANHVEKIDDIRRELLRMVDLATQKEDL